jgi:hypothetical protein
MKALTFATFVWLALAMSGFGRIGDDEKQIEAIYGKPAKVLEETGSMRRVGYTAGAFAVVVDFLNGISRREGFTKPDTSQLNDEEIKQILNVSAAQDITWKEMPGKQGDRAWQRSDNKAEAFLPARGTFFVVQDVTFVQPTEAK